MVQDLAGSEPAVGHQLAHQDHSLRRVLAPLLRDHVAGRREVDGGGVLLAGGFVDV
ncbi:hypothetical protein [Streptomyces xiamenensis]|uniref:hypothetical protein n=1 Tax=Streptomyces xiamenensis TaxID=408015 RepID=UPI0035D83B49